MSERELFWKWAKDENPKLVEEAETGCRFAKDILDYMFMGWVGSANRQGYKLVPVEPTEEMVDAGVEESDVDWKRLKFAYQAMIGAVE